MTTYNTGNPIGSTEVKDLYDNAQNFDTLANTTTLETVTDRLGVPRMSLHGFEQEAKRRFESIKFQPPIPYAPGIEVTTSSLTVDYLGVIYYALPSALPFTTGAWNPAQWSPVQNTYPGRELLVFDDYASASAAAATLPEGQVIDVAVNNTRYSVSGGLLTDERPSTPVSVPYGVVRSVQSKLLDMVSVKDFGAVGDGVTDDTAAIQAAIDAGKPYRASTKGRIIYFPPGIYKVSTIDLSGCHGVHLFGAGPYATEVFASGTNQVFKAVGSSAEPLNKASIKSMNIRGGGKDNALAHGVDIQWGNHCYLHDLVFFGCRNAINLSHQWQTSLRDISVHGSGADQSYIGVFMDATDLTYIDNAVQATNVFVQGTSGYGFRLINAQGSKFTNCEAGGSPMTYAWYIGDPPSGTVKCQWIHFTNCLGDSTVSAAWLFRQGAATELSQMQLSNCWAGNGHYGFYFDGCTYITAGNLLAVGNTNNGIRLVNSSYLTIANSQLNGNNEAASASNGDILIQGGSYNVINGNLSQMANSAGKSLIEAASTDANLISNNTLFQGATIIGANTKIFRNTGFKTESRGSCQIAATATSVSVSHGLGIAPTVNHIRITPLDNMGSATKFWVSAADASAFTLNVNTAPGSTITFAWSIDLVKA